MEQMCLYHGEKRDPDPLPQLPDCLLFLVTILGWYSKQFI